MSEEEEAAYGEHDGEVGWLPREHCLFRRRGQQCVSRLAVGSPWVYIPLFKCFLLDSGTVRDIFHVYLRTEDYKE